MSSLSSLSPLYPFLPKLHVQKSSIFAMAVRDPPEVSPAGPRLPLCLSLPSASVSLEERACLLIISLYNSFYSLRIENNFFVAHPSPLSLSIPGERRRERKGRGREEGRRQEAGGRAEEICSFNFKDQCEPIQFTTIPMSQLGSLLLCLNTMTKSNWGRRKGFISSSTSWLRVHH